MDKLVIEGGLPLKGEVRISGSKNACLPIMSACLLTDDKCMIDNIPQLKDVLTMSEILSFLGVDMELGERAIVRKSGSYENFTAPYDIVSTMRASICVLGPLLAKKKKAKVSFPGGCVIGPRPIDLHIKGLRALGAEIKIEGGYIVARAKKLQGANIYLGGHFGSSVLATANVMMAATLARGESVIHCAACEPEIADLAKFLIKMGAKIEGYSTPIIKIKGVRSLHGARHRIMPDRIETGTYMIASCITGGSLHLKGAESSHLMAVIDVLRQANCLILKTERGLLVKRAKRDLSPVSVSTLPYPGFPTDMQAQIMSLMCVANGISVVTEKIFPERFIHISELNRMGSQIFLEGPSAVISGVAKLSGARVMASDLRASAALVLAGLVARGKTEVHRIYHLDRGYECIEEKLSKVGARIKRIKDD
ncbi:MAG: UDP-N-acetylglucosamine 1-carboxyvinyltransferase [Candidatus Omnitrophica bacterium]|nr:UDP-N-acetylglucosamine 1-carboxyvinyltransferase [Candidatus Omnitrophota bacterium]